MKEVHKEALQLFLDCKNVGKALQQQLSEAFDPIYLEALQDSMANAINIPIWDVI